MKKTTQLVIALCIAAWAVQAQSVMVIQKKGGEVTRIPVDQIDRITYETAGAPTPSANTVRDADGNVYKTVRIGHQVWMAENLRTTKYNDGTPIQHLPDYKAWENASSGAYSWYMNNIDSKPTYGGLYNWHAVNTGKLCPVGWHVPIDEEWTALLRELGSIPGAKLKEVGQANWKDNTDNVTNETGFTALPGGYRINNGNFSSAGTQGNFWTTSRNGDKEAFYRGIYNYTSLVLKYSFPLSNGLSVRCVRD